MILRAGKECAQAVDQARLALVVGLDELDVAHLPQVILYLPVGGALDVDLRVSRHRPASLEHDLTHSFSLLNEPGSRTTRQLSSNSWTYTGISQLIWRRRPNRLLF